MLYQWAEKNKMSERTQLVGDAIGCEIHDDTLIAGIGNEESGNYVLFQRSASDSKEDVWFEFDEQSNGGCDQLKHCKLANKRLTIEMKEPKAGVTYFDVALACDHEEVATLREQLKKIFSSSPGIIEII